MSAVEIDDEQATAFAWLVGSTTQELAILFAEDVQYDVAEYIYEHIVDGRLDPSGPVSFTHFVPGDTVGFTADFAPQFGLPHGMEDLLVASLPYLERMGVAVKRTLVAVPKIDSHGGVYPAVYHYCIG